jgi:hypothetical protein
LVNDAYLTTGVHHYYGVKAVKPDGRAGGSITFLTPELYQSCLWVGKKSVFMKEIELSVTPQSPVFSIRYLKEREIVHVDDKAVAHFAMAI